jgi:hypothetical protein
MAMSTPQDGVETSTRVRAFPIWRGVLVGLGVVFGLLALGELVQPLSQGFRRAFGGVMVLVHGMVAFAIVALLGQALRIAESERVLADQRDRLAPQSGADPLLDEPIDLPAFRAEIQQTTHELSERRDESKRISQVVTYLVPLVGFAVTVATWEARRGEPWGVSVRPLFVSLGESFFVLLLSLGVCNSVEALRRGWLGLIPGTSANGLPNVGRPIPKRPRRCTPTRKA